MKQEPMKLIPGCDGRYSITKDGRVWSHRRKLFRQTNFNAYGYLVIGLRYEGVTRPIAVHRLLALTYIPNPEQLDTVNHKDGNKLNNSLDNLEWMSRGDNTRHSWETGLQASKVGSNNGASKLTEDDIKDIRASVGESQKSIAARFNVDASTISLILSKKVWTHV